MLNHQQPWTVKKTSYQRWGNTVIRRDTKNFIEQWYYNALSSIWIKRFLKPISTKNYIFRNSLDEFILNNDVYILDTEASDWEHQSWLIDENALLKYVEWTWRQVKKIFKDRVEFEWYFKKNEWAIWSLREGNEFVWLIQGKDENNPAIHILVENIIKNDHKNNK